MPLCGTVKPDADPPGHHGTGRLPTRVRQPMLAGILLATVLIQGTPLPAAPPRATAAARPVRLRQQAAGFGHSPVPSAASTSGTAWANRSLILRTSGEAPADSEETELDWPGDLLSDSLPAEKNDSRQPDQQVPPPATTEETPANPRAGSIPRNADGPISLRHGPPQMLPEVAPGHSLPALLPQTGQVSDSSPCDTQRLRRLFDNSRGGNLLDRFGIHLDGWVEQGLTFNFDPPQNDSNLPGAGFNDAANEYMLNQLYFRLKKEPPTDRDVMGLGFQTDLLFGTDARFVTADGLDDSWAADHRYYRIALPQAFLDLYLPAGPGIRLKVGRYYAVSDYETVPAPENFFYSHTYSLQYGQPLTLTGTLSSFRISPAVDLNFGLHRGWDDFADEDSGGPGVLGAITWRNPSERFRLAAVWIVSEERQQLYSTVSGVRAAADGTRFLQTLVATARLSQRLSAVWQATYGQQSDAAAMIDSTSVPVSTIRLQDAEWYGLTQYLFYDLSPQLSFGGRVEWFRDDDGTRVPDGQSLATGGLRNAGTVQSALSSGSFRSGGNYSALTLGCNWRPSCGLTVRPELRFDWSDVSRRLPVSASGPFHDLSSSSQITLGTDIIWLF